MRNDLVKRVRSDIPEQIAWCIDRHEQTNHYYDEYLPYEFHLRMVAKVCEDFKYLLPDEPYNQLLGYMYKVVCELACWGHDLIEDTRTSYNDVLTHLGKEAADIVYAVTNEKGKNRAERGNDKYYEGICNTKGAVFVKLCDRIANVQYSKMTGSRMYDLYKKENKSFLEHMGFHDDHELYTMFSYLIKLFE